MIKNPAEQLPKDGKYIGTKSISGHECYEIEILKKDKKNYGDRIWIDTKKLVMRKIKQKTVVTYFSNFKKLKGFFNIPRKINIHMDAKGKTTSEAIIKSIKINQGISSTLFNINKIDASSNQMDMQKAMNLMKEFK